MPSVLRIVDEDGDVRILIRHGDHDQSDHGAWASGGGGSSSSDDDDEDGGGGGGEPVRLASASGGGRQVATYTDPNSDEPFVAVSQHGEKLGSPDDAEVELTVEQAGAAASGLDQMMQIGRDAPTPSSPNAFDDGPAVLGSVEDGGLRVTAFHDANGDSVDEGGRFIQVSESGSDWRDSLRGANDGRLLDVNLDDAPGLAGALRQVTGAGS